MRGPPVSRCGMNRGPIDFSSAAKALAGIVSLSLRAFPTAG